MAFSTPLYGTGFEMGAVPLLTSLYTRCGITSTAAYVKTGAYAFYTQSQGGGNPGWAKFPVTGTPSELYISAWAYPPGTVYTAIGVMLDDGKVIELRKNVSTTTWDLFVDGVEVDTGSIVVPGGQYQHIQTYFNIDNSGGVTTKINGVEDINYSGDTQPAASAAIEYVRVYQEYSSAWYSAYWDNLAFGTGGWGGDIRFDKLSPNGDDSVEWTPTSGDNYTTVDEVPPSDADYVSAGSPNLTDLYTMSDWSGSGKSPQFITEWARAKKDVAEDRALELLVDSGGSESSSGSFQVSTSFAYYYHIFDTDPSTGSLWTDGTLDALKAGIRSY